MTATVVDSECEELEKLFDRLWPICRSLTGDGVRETHDIISEYVPLERIEIASGTKVFDWIIPPEWRVNEAYVLGPDGKRIIDFAENNLHLVSYSAPFKGTMTLKQFNKRLHSIPEQPEAIPYLTSYYNKNWGFCVTQNQRDSLVDGNYQIVVDTEFLDDGYMTLSEAVLPGESDKEILISTYTCHPSMANNELSGPLVSTMLYRRLAQKKDRKYTYRFAYLVETVGAVAYLSLKGAHLKKRLAAGLVITCLGGVGDFQYKNTITKNSLADRATKRALEEMQKSFQSLPFFPWGSDERQYGSPGIRLPVGMLMRGKFFEEPEYHTSLDNKELIDFRRISEAVDVLESTCQVINFNNRYLSNIECGEPQFSRYGLYPDIGANREIELERQALLWVMALSDGEHDLIDIANLSGLTVAQLHEAVEKCLEAEILSVVK